MTHKYLLMALAVCGTLSLNAQKNYEQGNPKDANYDYLKHYKPLKEYIDREKYPNFKLGLAIGANDYLNNSTVKNVSNNYFDETVTGNAMKMASCVDGSGNMNFTTVKNFVNAASKAGLNIYGHTLAWHAQQPVGWLKSLIKDRKTIQKNPDGTPVWNEIAAKDFRKQQSVGWNTSSDANFGYMLTFDATNGLKVHTTKKTQNFWDVQYIVMDNIPTEKGKNCKLTITLKATGTGNLHSKLGDWGGGPSVNIPFTKEWQDVEVTYKGTLANSFLLLQSGDFVGDIWIKSIRFEQEEEGKVVYEPLTAEEKHDTLVYAMDRWIKGIMTATAGKVKAWDLVNEAISGGGADKEGVYALQHYNGSEGDFFWQDHMGDLEYVRQAARLARKHYAEVMEKQGGDDGQLKLFVNDYNLESDWDNNGKLKSLIKWIKRWEADGVTKIDGIGSQMHISCYMNTTTQNNKKKAIENSFKLMAQSGKLVRISELDMGLDDANGKPVPTSKMTEAMHKRMADLYEWIVKKYFEIIPPEQQWGICQWCATDSPSNSGWRADTPVGLWNLDWYRKHTYAGVARGLGAPKDPTAIETVEADITDNTPTIIHDMTGRTLHAESLDALPSGIYIVNGRKVYKR